MRQLETEWGGGWVVGQLATEWGGGWEPQVLNKCGCVWGGGRRGPILSPSVNLDSLYENASKG